MKYFFCFLFSLSFIAAFGQYENVWVWNGSRVNGLNFNSGQPVPFASAITGAEAHAMVCDGKGALLFYTNGNRVWNKQHNIMKSGSDLLQLPGVPNPVASTHQGTVIVPFPDDFNKYYIFSLTSMTGGAGFFGGQLYYSVVDISLDGGMGEVVRSGIYIEANFIEGISAVPGNNCNVWVLGRTLLDGSLRAYEVTGNGITMTPIVSTVAAATTVGSIRIAPNREKILLTDINYYLLDFDPFTGKANNLKAIMPDNNNQLGWMCVPEFSPNSQFLYAYDDRDSSISQFKVTLNTASEIYDSKVKLSHTERTGSASPKHDFRRGPDGKIYLSNMGNIERINRPNDTGLKCGYESGVFVRMTLGAGGGPNVVPVIRKGVTFSTQNRVAGCFVTTLTLKATNDSTGWDYQWSNGASVASIVVDTPGTYWLQYKTPPCNFHTDSFFVAFPLGALPDLFIRPACRKQQNGQAYMSTHLGNPVQYSYTWLNARKDTLSTSDTLAGVGPGSYGVYVHTSSGCDTTLFFEIGQEEHHVFFEVDSLLCLGDTLLLNNTSDAHFKWFLWDFGDGQTSSDFSPAHIYPVSGLFRVRLMGEGPVCKDTVSADLIVDAPIKELVFTMKREHICVGEVVTFYTEKAPTTLSHHWNFGAEGSFSTLEPSFSRAFSFTGSVPVTLNARFRVCPDRQVSDTLYIAPLPHVALGADSLLCWTGKPMPLTNSFGHQAGDQYNWNTGATTASITVQHPGLYSLTVTNAQGCSTTETVSIGKDCYLDIPNAFTPNGDGFNDHFFPRQLLSKSVSRFKMQIFNRWGQTMFESTNLEGRGWDGRFNGTEQPAGSYLYLIEVILANGQQEYYRGNMTLMR